jgi:DNA-binding Xre family transcriptional regulator
VNDIDKKILELIGFMIYHKYVPSIKKFCAEIEMPEQTISKIKKGTAHFTVLQIESICKRFGVNANWIFGIEDEIFNNVESKELEENN